MAGRDSEGECANRVEGLQSRDAPLLIFVAKERFARRARKPLLNPLLSLYVTSWNDQRSRPPERKRLMFR
jgi:hypothetical protein